MSARGTGHLLYTFNEAPLISATLVGAECPPYDVVLITFHVLMMFLVMLTGSAAKQTVFCFTIIGAGLADVSSILNRAFDVGSVR